MGLDKPDTNAQTEKQRPQSNTDSNDTHQTDLEGRLLADEGKSENHQTHLKQYLG